MSVTITKKVANGGTVFTFRVRPSLFYRIKQLLGLHKKGSN